MRNGVVEAIPQPERYFHQVRGQVIGMRAVLAQAREKKTEIRTLTSGARMRGIRAGANPTAADAVVVDYTLVSRGTEPVWMSQGQGAAQTFALQNVPVWLKYDVTRTVPRARGYVLPPSIAKIVPLLMDHGIQVHRFTKADTLELEVYDATGIQRNEYFQGHYLKSVTGVEKRVERVAVPVGSYFVSTAQSRGNLISYLMEPETDDNLITWGWLDHVLQVRPATVEEAIRGMLGDTDINSLTPQQRTQMEAQANAVMARRQRVPMMRMVTAQPMSLLEVTRFGDENRTRYWLP